jgi:hypothetical protein
LSNVDHKLSRKVRVIWDHPPLCWACAVLMRLRQLSLCRHINKATARPEGSKIDCSADNAHESDSVNGGFVNDFASTGEAIGWLASGNLNRWVGNPIQTRTGPCTGEVYLFWPMLIPTGGSHSCLAPPFLHRIAAPSMSRAVFGREPLLAGCSIDHKQPQKEPTKYELSAARCYQFEEGGFSTRSVLGRLGWVLRY